jgi:Cu+-exporting ATPase
LYPVLRLVVSPELAAALMALSSVSVTLNTLLLKRFRPSLRGGQPLPRATQGAEDPSWAGAPAASD